LDFLQSLHGGKDCGLIRVHYRKGGR
jgi:hypothetical protein